MLFSAFSLVCLFSPYTYSDNDGVPSFIFKAFQSGNTEKVKMNQHMRKGYLSQRRPVKAQARLRISAVSPEPLLFVDM